MNDLAATNADDTFLAGGGDAGALIRSIDWSRTALGPTASWPMTLRTTVGIMLASRFAMRVLWGPDFIFLHNDAYRPVLGDDKYPSAMGSRTAESFAEVWAVVGPMFHRAMAGEAVAFEDGSLPLVRHGYLEECFFTLSYSPLSDDHGGIGGVLGVVHETTARVVAERRLEVLRALATGVAGAQTTDAVCRAAATALAGAGADVPFALLYLHTDEPVEGRLAAHVGLEACPAARPAVIAMGEEGTAWPLTSGVPGARRWTVTDLATRFGALHGGPYPEPIVTALVLPLERAGSGAPYGHLVVGISPRRRLDADYEVFFELATEHIAAALANAVAIAAAEGQRAFLAGVINQIPSGIIIAEASGTMMLSNALGESILGRNIAETRSTAELPARFRAFHQDGRPFAVDDYPLVRALAGELVIDEEVLFDRPDGKRRTILVSASPVHDPSHHRVAAVSAFNDITDRKRMEDTLRESEARADRARKEAEEASRAKDEFLAIVSHELRNPLNAMLGWTRLLRAGTLTPERAERALEIIERNATNQAALIEDLLDVSRVIAGKLPLDVQTVTFARVIEAALDSAAPAIEAKGLRLRVVLDTDAVLSGDPARLQQIVWNLLTNATKFTPRGGSIRVELRRDDSHLELSVTDSGQGIAPSFLAHVFDRFKQADPSTTRQHGGLGLGLAIAKNLVEMHGGTIEARSEGLGHGATFVVRVPLAAVRRSPVPLPPVRPTPTASAFSTPPELRGLRVLVVDDEPDARELVTAVLVDCGVDVRSASSVEEAMRAIATQVPDVLLSDIGMPQVNGYSFIAQVRALPRASGGAMPAACLTGYTTSEDRRRALEAGFNIHLSKPVEPNELIAVVASLGRMAQTLGT